MTAARVQPIVEPLPTGNVNVRSNDITAVLSKLGKVGIRRGAFSFGKAVTDATPVRPPSLDRVPGRKRKPLVAIARYKREGFKNL